MPLKGLFTPAKQAFFCFVRYAIYGEMNAMNNDGQVTSLDGPCPPVPLCTVFRSRGERVALLRIMKLSLPIMMCQTLENRMNPHVRTNHYAFYPQ